MSLSLKDIPCPAGNTCTAFQCIFGHDKDNINANDAPTHARPSPDGNASPTPNKEPLDNGEMPRKRQRVDRATSGETKTNSPGANGLDISGSSVAQGRSPSGLRTATRPVSPPPLKRPKSLATTPQTASSAPSPKAQKTLPQNRKAETLNPRLLKNSPASHDIRLKLLKMLFQEFSRLNAELKKDAKDDELKLVYSEQGLIRRALDEEQSTAVEKGAVYANVMKNKVMSYRRMKVSQWKSDRVKETDAAKKKHTGKDVSDKPKVIETGLAAEQEVRLLQRILTPIDKFSNHGYVPIVPSDESIDKARDGVAAAKGWEKCDRCQQRFQVFPGRREEDGALTTNGPCNHHWGKAYVPEKAPGDTSRVPKRYRCCGQEVGESAGCTNHEHHVYKVSDPKRLAAVLNFAETPENMVAPADRGVCFDCEMCYTVYGLELIRLTATAWPTGEELLDVLVHPLGEILDLNSRFSGVWPEDLAQAEPWTADADPRPSKSGAESASEEGELPGRKTHKIVSSPEVARDLLFSLLSRNTPLIGHGLENDLNAVRVVHPTLIDTVLLYPHRAGLPFRQGLKMLMDTQLNRKIQQDVGDKALGHDSAEDARAAGELVRLRVAREWKDMQRAGWRVEDGEFVAPGKKNATEGGLTKDFIES